MTEPQSRLVQPVRNGPVLVAGPVRIETAEGVVESDRFMVAICACGRSRNYPLCDTSHRRRDTSHRG
jgi:CDGSH-type Zn-finger protein